MPQASPEPGDACHGTGAPGGHLPTWRQVRAHLAGRSLLAATSVAVALGVVMIVLKDVVLIHLH